MKLINSLINTLKKITKRKFLIIYMIIILIIATCFSILKYMNMKKEMENEKQETFTNSFEKNSVCLFSAKWCGNCTSMMPTWNKFMKENQGINGLDIVKIDADENEQVVKKYNIDGFPTIVHLKNGVIQSKYAGDRTLKSFREYLKTIVGY